jgi:solute carrier family 25 iron transporter 28/37
MFAGCIPAHAAYFSLFENMKVFLGADKEGHHPIKAAICGAAATFSHDLCMTPFDTVKQRMQLGYYKNLTDCIRSIRATEGVRAFYYSFPTTVMMNLPFGCVTVAVNESARKVINPSGKYNFMSSMLAGSIAGTVAAAVTTPLDVIKTKLQTQNLEPCPRVGSIRILGVNSVETSIASHNVHGIVTNVSLNYKSSSQVIEQIIKDGGYAGFFRGMGARMLVHAPSVAISWTAYETFKTFLIQGNLL